MKTVISKEFRHSILVDEEHLQTIHKLITDKYECVNVVASCIDGTRLESEQISDILLFENASFRRIKSISWQGQDTSRLASERGIRNSISLDFGSIKPFYSIVEMRVESHSDQEALYISDELVKRIHDMKPWYDLPSRVTASTILFFCWLLMISFITISRAFGFVLLESSSASFIDSMYVIITVAFLGSIILFPVLKSLDKAWEYLFPRVFFSIGRQMKALDTVKKWRKAISSIILTLILGVISSMIYVQFFSWSETIMAHNMRHVLCNDLW